MFPLVVIEKSTKDGDGLGQVGQKKDSFVRALVSIMREHDYTAKDISLMSGVNDQTVRKLIRESRGSNKVRNAIAVSLGFNSFADLYLLDERKKEIERVDESEDLYLRNEISDLKSRLRGIETTLALMNEKLGTLLDPRFGADRRTAGKRTS